MYKNLLSLFFISFLLVACGGGGGSGGSTSGDRDSSSTTQDMVLSIRNGEIRWQNPDSSKVDSYKVFAAYEFGAGYEEISGLLNVDSEHFLLSKPLHLSITRVPESILVEAYDGSSRFVESASIDTSFVNFPQLFSDYIKSSNPDESERFGHSIDISADGNTLVVGNPDEDSDAVGINGDQSNNLRSRSGAAYVFVRNNGRWQQQAYLKASNPDRTDLFGNSVSISSDGNTLAVSATGEGSILPGINPDQSSNDSRFVGAVYVFKRVNNIWAQTTYIKASNPDEHDLFGDSVALSDNGKVLAVSASNEDSYSKGVNGDQNNDYSVGSNGVYADGSGAVYLFRETNNVWTQEAYVKASNTEWGSYFGRGLAISGDGNTVAVGSPWEAGISRGIDGDQTTDRDISYHSGAAYIFAWDGSNWYQESYVKASNSRKGTNFGGTLALSYDGSTLVIGAEHETSNAVGVNGDQTDDSLSSAGAVYVFDRDAGEWNQQAYLKASNTEEGDQFGISVDLSGNGNTLVVGAHTEDSSALGINGDQLRNDVSNSGAVYVFKRDEIAWTQETFLKASNTGEGDIFGSSLALSSDGQTIAVGAEEEESLSPGINGDQNQENILNVSVGAVYVY